MSSLTDTLLVRMICTYRHTLTDRSSAWMSRVKRGRCSARTWCKSNAQRAMLQSDGRRCTTLKISSQGLIWPTLFKSLYGRVQVRMCPAGMCYSAQREGLARGGDKILFTYLRSNRKQTENEGALHPPLHYTAPPLNHGQFPLERRIIAFTVLIGIPSCVAIAVCLSP